VSSFAKVKVKDNKKEGGLVKFKDENDKKGGVLGFTNLTWDKTIKGEKGTSTLQSSRTRTNRGREVKLYKVQGQKR
jgi:hypothetical protein